VEQNGRLTVAGFGNALLTNVESESGAVVLQGGSLVWDSGLVRNTVATGTAIASVTYKNLQMGSHTQGAAKTLAFQDCVVRDTFGASAVKKLTLNGGEYSGTGSGTTTDLVGIDQPTPVVEIKDAKFSVSDVARVRLLAQPGMLNAAWTVVNSTTVSISRALYLSSKSLQALTRIGIGLYTSDSRLAAIVTRLPYDSGGTGLGATIQVGVRFVRTTTTGTVLYLSQSERIDLSGVTYNGPFADGVSEWGGIVTAIPVGPCATAVRSDRITEDSFFIASWQYPSLVYPSYLQLGGMFDVTDVTFNVLRAYTGATATAIMSIRDGTTSNTLLTINIKSAGKRATFVGGGVANGVAGDAAGNPQTPTCRSFSLTRTAGLLVASPGEEAIWAIRVAGRRAEQP
jgi:hypothetical protein